MSRNTLFVEEIKGYHKRAYPQAKELLSKIFQGLQLSDTRSLKVLLPCAGTFPSFQPFCEIISELYPHIQEIEFGLIDVDLEALECFETLYSKKRKFGNITIKTTIVFNGEFNSYLEKLRSSINASPIQYDLIYFEHPVIDTINSLLKQKTAAFRQAIPHLTQVLKSDGVVVAVCTSDMEIMEMKKLLAFSFNVQPKIISQACSIVFPTDFSKILRTKVTKASSSHSQAKSEAIKQSDKQFLGWLIFSFLLYLTVLGKGYESHLSVVLFVSQFYLHHPGPKGVAIKAIICLTQASLLLNNIISTEMKLKP